MRRRSLAAALTLCVVATACAGGSSAIEVVDARIGAPQGPNAALYLTAVGGDKADRLVGARSTVASEVHIHETTHDEDGTVAMSNVDGLDLPAGGRLVLEPGGYHLMLTDVERLNPGDEVDITLIWENGGEWTISAEVVDPADTVIDDD